MHAFPILERYRDEIKMNGDRTAFLIIPHLAKAGGNYVKLCLLSTTRQIIVAIDQSVLN